MKLMIALPLVFLLSACAMKFGDVKKGGVVEHMEKHYSTDIRTPLVGSAILLTMDSHLLPMVINYCTLQKGKVVSVWCVDENEFPLFNVKYSASNTAVMVNGSMQTIAISPKLQVIERNNTASDEEWLKNAKERWEFDPVKIAELNKK